MMIQQKKEVITALIVGFFIRLAAFIVASTRRRKRLCLYDLLDRRSITCGLHLRSAGVFLRMDL